MKYITELFLSLLALFSPAVYATDTYNHVNNQLTIPAVVLGETIYRDVVITVGPILTVGGSNLDSKYPAKPASTMDSYDPYKNQLTIPSVNAYGFVYYDVIINVGTVLSVKSAEPVIKPRITLYKTSYENAKLQNLPRLNFPYRDFNAYAVGNFFGDNNMAVIISKPKSLQCYRLDGIDPSCLGSAPDYVKDELRAEIQFYKLAINGNMEQTSTTLKGCLTPRKSIVADFNNDGHSDIFIVCHGWDNFVFGRFRGEANKLLLNDSAGRGNFTVSDVGAAEYSFYHGAAAADIDSDGWIDIVITDSNRSPGNNITILINQKNGTFAFDNTRVFGQGNTAGYYSVELVDVDKDGIIDIIAGGHESPIGIAETVILYGSPNKTFGSRKTVIPGVADAPVALDFTVLQNTANQTVVYIGRTSYGVDVLQAYNLSTGISSILYNRASTAFIEWWTPQVQNGVSGIAPYATKNPDIFFSK